MKEKEEETVVSIIGRRVKKGKKQLHVVWDNEKNNGVIKNH